MVHGFYDVKIREMVYTDVVSKRRFITKPGWRYSFQSKSSYGHNMNVMVSKERYDSADVDILPDK